jgi:hypothetical protein
VDLGGQRLLGTRSRRGPGSGLNPDYPGSTTAGGIVPNGCSTHPLTPQEEAIEFMMFDIAHCLIPVGQ